MQKSPTPNITESTKRLLLVGLILCGWALAIALRLLDLQVFAHSEYVRLGQSQQERLEPITPHRGAIFDRNGNYLAISNQSLFAVANPQRIPDKETAAQLLAGVLHVDAERLQSDLEAAAQSRRHRGYFVVDLHVSPEEAETLRRLKLDWLELRQGSVRTYPNGGLAAHVLGQVNAEGKGSAGVELKLERELAGKPGLMRVEMDVRQHAYASEVAKSPTVGKDVGLTLDTQLQHVAEDALKQAVKESHAVHGSVVAMDPRTGDILALANYPTFDPNDRLHPGEKAVGREDLAVVAPFEPGSVFKVITLSAALETTRLRPETIINCGNGILRLPGRVVHDHKPFPSLSMENVLAESSNIGAIHIGMTVGDQTLYDYVKRFGFGHRTGIELPAEAPGLVRPLRRWQTTSLASVSMGHEISATSIQLAQAASVIANGGFLIHPHIVKWKQEPGGEKQFFQPAKPQRVLEPETVRTMRRMMEHVVVAGTGTKAHVLGYTTGGKTGTAQIFDFAHHVYTHNYNASFMGFVPVANPNIVVVATVSGTSGLGGYGGTASTPVFQSVAGNAMRMENVPRDLPQEIEEEEMKRLAKEKKQMKGRLGVESEDDVALATVSTPPSSEDLKESLGEPSPDGAITISDAAVAGPKAPNFLGRTVKDVVQEAAERGIAVDLRGEGVARTQSLPAGTIIGAGEHIQVGFAR